MKRILAILTVLLLLTSFACAVTQDDLSWNGFLDISLDKTSFGPSENITGTISAVNSEDFSVIGGKIVIQVGQGTYEYPAQFAEDNTLLEQTITSDLWLLPTSMKATNFSLPPMKSGDYHLDAYAWVLKSKFMGSNAIFYGPKTAYFTVTGTAATTNAEIVRSKTYFTNGTDNSIGPVGFPVSAGGQFSGKVYVTNPTTSTKSGLTLLVSVCDWSSAFCDNPKETSFAVGQIAPGAEAEVGVLLVAPTTPSAYDITMKLMNGSNVESLFKNRVIVTGPTAELRKVSLDGLKDRNYSFNVIFSGSPDHFTTPSFENFEIGLDLYKANEKIESHSENIAKIDFGGVDNKIFLLDAKAFDKACVSVTKGGVTYDEECFTVPLKELQEAYDALHPEEMKVDYKYLESTGQLSVTLSKEKTNMLNARVRITKDNSTIFVSEVSQSSPFSKTYSVPQEDLVMIIDDFDAKAQKVVNLNFGEQAGKTPKATVSATAADEACTANVCGNGFVCSTTSYASKDGVCCMSECIPAVSSSGGMSLGDVPFVFWVAVLLVILAVVIAGETVFKMKKRGRSFRWK